MSTKPELHEYAAMLPMPDDTDIEARVNEIKAGCPPVIIMYEGRILDGYDRYLAAARVGAYPAYNDYLGDDPLGFAIQNNRYRHHMTPSQLTLLAVDYYLLRKKGGYKVTSKSASKISGVSWRHIERGVRIRKYASLDLQRQIIDGTLSIEHVDNALAKAEADLGVRAKNASEKELENIKDRTDEIIAKNIECSRRTDRKECNKNQPLVKEAMKQIEKEEITTEETEERQETERGLVTRAETTPDTSIKPTVAHDDCTPFQNEIQNCLERWETFYELARRDREASHDDVLVSVVNEAKRIKRIHGLAPAYDWTQQMCKLVLHAISPTSESNEPDEPEQTITEPLTKETEMTPSEKRIHDIVRTYFIELKKNVSVIIVAIKKDGTVTFANDRHCLPIEKYPYYFKGTFKESQHLVPNDLYLVRRFNLIAKRCIVDVHNNGQVMRLICKRGIPVGPVSVLKKTEKCGTQITITPDPEIFPDGVMGYDALKYSLQYMAYVCRGITVSLRDEKTGQKEKFFYPKEPETPVTPVCEAKAGQETTPPATVPNEPTPNFKPKPITPELIASIAPDLAPKAKLPKKQRPDPETMSVDDFHLWLIEKDEKSKSIQKRCKMTWFRCAVGEKLLNKNESKWAYYIKYGHHIKTVGQLKNYLSKRGHKGWKGVGTDTEKYILSMIDLFCKRRND